jgi:hypothetical protein
LSQYGPFAPGRFLLLSQWIYSRRGYFTEAVYSREENSLTHGT